MKIPGYLSKNVKKEYKNGEKMMKNGQKIKKTEI
jgi:hypothetical protein